MKKLWPFKDERAKLSGNFAAETPFGRVFRSCETTFWHMSAIWKPCTIILQLRNLHTLKSFSVHTMNRHVTAAPPFRQFLDTSRSLIEVQIMYTISCFKSWEVRSPQLQTVLDLDLKRKSYGCLKMTVQTMNGNVAPPFCYCWTHF